VTAPLSDERLAEIRADKDAMELAEVVELLAEVDRLRADLNGNRAYDLRRRAERERDQMAQRIEGARDDFTRLTVRATEAEAERDRLAEQVKRVLEAAHWALTTSADDWGATFGKAWIYGIFVGWWCEEDHEHDLDDCGNDGALQELTERFDWTPEHVEALRSLRASVLALDGTS
jgi:hypothetical protein